MFLFVLEVGYLIEEFWGYVNVDDVDYILIVVWFVVVLWGCVSVYFVFVLGGE